MTWIEIDKELEWVTAWDKEDRHVGVISKHECVVDVEWVEELLTQFKRLRERLEVIEDFVNDELRAFVNSNTFDHIYDAIEKKLESEEE
jgi:septation ring formation regulator EzrA